jgi:hypothetical protein
MTLHDLAQQVAADAIALTNQAQPDGTIFMRTTPLEFLGVERLARAQAFAHFVRSSDSIDNVADVAERLLPALKSFVSQHAGQQHHG